MPNDLRDKIISFRRDARFPKFEAHHMKEPENGNKSVFQRNYHKQATHTLLDRRSCSYVKTSEITCKVVPSTLAVIMCV
jgi:hypothetical protein